MAAPNPDLPCTTPGCDESRHPSRTRCRKHFTEAKRRQYELNPWYKRRTPPNALPADQRPCNEAGCPEPRAGGYTRCREHRNALTREANRRLRSTPEGLQRTRDIKVAWRLRHGSYLGGNPDNRRAYYEAYRRHREAPFAYERADPWPTDCGLCGRPIDPSEVHGPGRGRHNPLAETLGHEPPIGWLAANPSYNGPLVIRPEHWSCNSAKRDKPDWMLQTG